MEVPVAAGDDERLAVYRQLKENKLRRVMEPERGIFMAESTEVITRALAGGIEPLSVLVAPKLAGKMSQLLAQYGFDVPVYVSPDQVLRDLIGFHLHRGAIAAMRRPVLPPVEDVLAGARRVVIAENIVDHTNVGAIFRCAAGLGMDAVLVTPRCADPLYRRAVRVSMGTIFQVPWTRLEPWPGGLERLRADGFTVAAMALSEQAVALDRFAQNLPDRLALMVGTEGEGLTAQALDLADVAVSIPMAGGVDSLNVAAAAAVAFWAVRGAGPGEAEST